VVADSVRELSNKTQDSARESGEIVMLVVDGIRLIIRKMAKVVDSNEKLAESANKSLRDIESMYNSFANTVSLIAETSASSGKIEQFIESITESLGEINSALEFTNSQTSGIIETATSIRDEANGLKDRLSGLQTI